MFNMKNQPHYQQMKRNKYFVGYLCWNLLVCCCFLFFYALHGSAAIPTKKITALDRYVATPDTNYQYQVIKEVPQPKHTAFLLEMISQQWLTTNEVDRPLWKHWVWVIRPKQVKHSTALLFISGGNNNKPAPEKPDGKLVQISEETESVVVELRMIPNQPLTFTGDKEGRVEDSLIAYTWDKFLRTGDEKWPARLPMTKSAVRAMDTVSNLMSKPQNGGVQVDKYVVAGGSKRGWTTWTTAVVDSRVVAIIPIVIDLLNIQPSFKHHYAAYGFWAPAVDDYTNFRIMDWTGTPEYAALMKIVEPYEYRDRLTMPKFIINATGDQFFLPDSSQFYFSKLKGVKYLRYVPNADHSLKDSDAWNTVFACYEAVLNDAKLPIFEWTFEKNNVIRVKTAENPTEVKCWYATNPKARDFRLETIGTAWQSQKLTESKKGVYIASVPMPKQGWTAFMVELTYSGKGKFPYKFTTDVRVIPDILPYKFNPTKKPTS